MGLFRKKKEPTAEEKRHQAIEDRRLMMLQRLHAALESDPAFQLCTFDGINWIDPFTLLLVPAPFDYKTAAMKHFQQHNHWRGQKPKTVVEVRAAQWQHYLQDHYDADTRFQFFAKEGNWLNPFNGRICAGVIRHGGSVTPDLMKGMARVLAGFPEARPDKLMSLDDLFQKFPALHPSYEHGGVNEVTDNMISADEIGQFADLAGPEPAAPAKPATAAASAKPAVPVKPAADESVIETRAYAHGLAPPNPLNDADAATARAAPHYEATVSRGIERVDHGKATERTSSRNSRDAAPRPGDDASRLKQRHPDPEVGRDTERQSRPDRRDPPSTSRRRRSGDAAGPVPDTNRYGQPSTTSIHEQYVAPTHDTQADLKQARVVQTNLMGSIPEVKGLAFGLHYEPYQHIGGDFYDFIQVDEQHLCFIIGDISGHGTQAALVVGSILKSLHYLINQASAFDLTEILCRLNEDVRGDLISGQFFTAFIGMLQTGEQRKMNCICAGHHPSICLNPNGPNFLRRIGKNGMALGVATEAVLRKQLRITSEFFIPGDILCVYTDGVHEAMDPKGQEYGHWRARASFLANIGNSPQEICQNVASDVRRFAHGQPQDDVTVLAIRFD
jgi:serine phosphatase RsbU (regulator of sigma subunit)